MPLSSVVGAQSIVRPGVCTSSTRPASPYDGQVIYETDTDKGYVWDSSKWVQLFGQMPGFKATNSAAQTITISTLTVVTVGTETYDNGNVFSSNTCTIPTGYAGKWMFIGQVSWTTASTGDNKVLYITRQASGGGAPVRADIIAAQGYMAASGYCIPRANISVIHDAAEGDLFKMCVEHDGGGTIQILANSAEKPTFFQGYYLGQ